MDNEPAGGLGLLEGTELDSITDVPWNTVIYNDPINTFKYVIGCCLRILKCKKEQAELYTNQVHYEGKSLVYSGSKEQAELYAEAFSAAHLWCKAERAS
jgi:ATP-dependent Clp protease adaptor protein ClpS